MRLEKRIRELEKRFNRDPIVVTLADGREHVIGLRRGETPLDVYLRVIGNPDSEEARLIQRCLGIREPGGSRLLEFAKALLAPATEEPFDPGSINISKPVQC